MFGRDACRTKRCFGEVRALTAQMEEPLYRGAGAALVALLDLAKDWRSNGASAHVPGIWDERLVPVCGTDAPVTSFPWNGAAPNHPPAHRDAMELVCVVMDRLEMGAPEVVTAVVILESFMRARAGTLCPHSARPMLLACCTLACKLTTDADVTTPECCAAVRDCFTGLTALQVARIEEQMLVLLDWSFPTDPEVYRACARNLQIMGGAASTAREEELYLA
jgi:hypothetical protein